MLMYRVSIFKFLSSHLSYNFDSEMNFQTNKKKRKYVDIHSVKTNAIELLLIGKCLKIDFR